MSASKFLTFGRQGNTTLNKFIALISIQIFIIIFFFAFFITFIKEKL